MRRDARRSLESAGLSFASAPGEGLFLWGRVPDSVDVDRLVRTARGESILLAKGSLFSPSKGCGQWLRFNVAHSVSPPLIRFPGDSIRATA